MLRKIDVAESGAVILGERVVCDGFIYGIPYRVQSHVHDDHMEGFESSKQFQDILCSRATRDLLIAEYNADLKYRDNLIGLDFKTTLTTNIGKVTLFPSAHMLGAAQVLLETNDGAKLGYSGDFQWPMNDPIEVDSLVVDSTYGSPSKRREFTQDDANLRFLETVKRRLRLGPVNIKAFRGTIQRALEVLSGEIDVPIIASARLCRDVKVYRLYGCLFDRVIDSKGDESKAAIESGRYIRLYSKGDAIPDHANGSSILLSAFMSQKNDPLTEWNDVSYSIAFSDHADFEGTLEYIRATGARFVVTDNTRGHGVDLAIAVRERLGIDAQPSTNLSSKRWGT